MPQNQLNISDGHPLDMIRVFNPLNKEYTTHWDKQPFSVEAQEHRQLLRYIAVKLAREIADKIIGKKAHAAGKSVIHFASERIDILNQVLIEVVQPYIQGEDRGNVPSEQVLKKGETAIDIGKRSMLQELGIADKKPVSSPKDVAANIISAKPKKGTTIDPMEIRKEKLKLIERAKVLGIKGIRKNWSLSKIKKAILEG